MTQNKPKISADVQRAFDRHCTGWAALYVAGPECPVRGAVPGQNDLVWPVRVGVTGMLVDKETARADAQSPLWWQGVLFRLWARSGVDASNLKELALGYIRDRGPQLRHSWADLGPDTDVVYMEFEFKCMAESKGIAVLDDNELRAVLERLKN